MNINQIKYALDGSIKRAAEKAIRGPLFRNRKLSVADTIRLLIGTEGGSLDKILHAAGIEVTASAASQRRAQIDPAVFRAVFDSFNAACVDTEMFHGYRLFAVDGTTVNLPRNPASASFVEDEYGTLYFYYGNTRIRVAEHFNDKGKPIGTLIEDVIRYSAAHQATGN